MTIDQATTATFKDQARELEAIREKTSDYSWLWRACSETRPDLMPAIFDKLRKEVDPERPYFINEQANGICFAGDARDYPAALHAINPNGNAVLISSLIETIGGSSGDVVDAGTNIGVVAANLGRHLGDRGRVFAFEPSPETFKIAAATLALNGLKNVELTQAAVGDQNGQVSFQSAPGNSAIAAMVNHGLPFLNEYREISVPIVTIDSFMKNKSKNIILIKADVEGHEMQLLRGAAGTIKDSGPVVVYEFTPTVAHLHGWTQEDSIDFLSSLRAFDFYAVAEDISATRVPFPLPSEFQQQVNVYARPRSASFWQRFKSRLG